MRKFVGANVLRRSTDGKTTSNESWNGRQAWNLDTVKAIQFILDYF